MDITTLIYGVALLFMSFVLGALINYAAKKGIIDKPRKEYYIDLVIPPVSALLLLVIIFMMKMDLYTSLFYLAIFTLTTLMILAYKDDIEYEAYGFRLTEMSPAYFLLGCAVSAILLGLLHKTSQAILGQSMLYTSSIIQISYYNKTILLFITPLVTFVEECWCYVTTWSFSRLFKGTIPFKEKMWYATPITAVIFAVAHYPTTLSFMALAFSMRIIFNGLTIACGDLSASWGAHTMWNILVILLTT